MSSYNNSYNTNTKMSYGEQIKILHELSERYGPNKKTSSYDNNDSGYHGYTSSSSRSYDYHNTSKFGGVTGCLGTASSSVSMVLSVSAPK